MLYQLREYDVSYTVSMYEPKAWCKPHMLNNLSLIYAKTSNLQEGKDKLKGRITQWVVSFAILIFLAFFPPVLDTCWYPKRE